MAATSWARSDPEKGGKKSAGRQGGEDSCLTAGKASHLRWATERGRCWTVGSVLSSALYLDNARVPEHRAGPHGTGYPFLIPGVFLANS